MSAFRRWFRNSRFYHLYNFKDDLARGRLMLLFSTGFGNLAAVLTTGLFYTGFLIDNGINLTNIGIITFLPSLASLFTLLAPSILERFPKRKWILAAGKFLYYAVYILGGTLVPILVHDYTTKVILFAVTVLLGHSFNAIVTSGYTSWHINLMPESVRAEHFGINSIVGNVSAQGFGFLFALVVDAMPPEVAANTIVLLRYAGFAAGVVDVFILTRPVEFAYEKLAERPKLRDIFVLPLKNRKFSMCILVIVTWTFVANLPNSVINYRLLEQLHISYSTIQFINVLFPLVLAICLGPCRRLLNRFGWLEVFAVGGVIECISFIAYGFVAPENVKWLFPVVRITQHFISAGLTNIPFSNMQYMNLPAEGRTNYMSFYILSANIAASLGMMIGTWFVALFPDLSFPLLGISIGNIQLLQIAEGVGMGIVSVGTYLLRSRILPGDGSYEGRPARRK